LISTKILYFQRANARFSFPEKNFLKNLIKILDKFIVEEYNISESWQSGVKSANTQKNELPKRSPQ